MITNSNSNRGEMTMTNILDVTVSETGNQIINNQYTLLNILGTGSFAEVRRAKCNRTGNYFVNLDFYFLQLGNQNCKCKEIQRYDIFSS